MAEGNILNLYINTATFQKGYRWYQVDEGGSTTVMQNEPPIYEPLRQRDLTHNRSLVLFQTERGIGVFWGRDALIGPDGGSQVDWMRRTLGYMALVEFADLKDAVEFYSGLLRHWWPCRAEDGPALPELASRVGAIPEKQHLTPEEQPYPAIYALLKRWSSEKSGESASKALLQEQPLLALESAQRLQELEAYVRQDLPHSVVVRQVPSNGVQPLIVVARTLVPDRLQGIWRALTDSEDDDDSEDGALLISSDWEPTGERIAPALTPLPAKPVIEEPVIQTLTIETPPDEKSSADVLTVTGTNGELPLRPEDVKPTGTPESRRSLPIWFVCGLSLALLLLLLWWMGLLSPSPRSK